MEQRQTEASLTLTGRIDRKTHDISTLRDEHPDWDEMDDSEKLDASRDVEPDGSETVFNATTDRLHQYFVDNLDPSQTGSKDNITTLWLGLGTDGSAVATTDTDLTARTYEEAVTDSADNGKELLTSTFLDSTEGNGNTFRELGLFSGNPSNLSDSDKFMLNHATFSDVVKDNSKTVTFDVTLTFSDV